MKIRIYIITIVSLLLAIGCRTPERTLELIDRSASLAYEQPDSALLLIESVNAKRVHGKQDKARYRLAYSEALYYSQMDIECDSLTRPLFDYYYYSDNHEERARAMYQHGCVMYNLSKNAESMYALIEAERSLQYYDNPRLLGLVYRTMGDIYGSECLFNNALASHKKAYEVFQTLSLEYHKLYSLYSISEICVQLKEYDIAKEYLITILEQSTQIDCFDLYCCAADVLCELYVLTSRYEEIEQYIDVLDNCELYNGFDIQRNYYKAILHSYKGNREQALKYIDLADSCPNSNNIEVEYLKSIVFQNLGDIAQANYWLLQNKAQQEELLLSILELPVLNTQIDSLKQDIDIAKERAKNLRFRNIIVLMLLLFVAIIITIYTHHKMVMQQHEIEKYISMISELKQNQAYSSSKILEDIQSVYGNKLADMNNLLETYYEHGNTSRESYKIVDQVKSIIESIRNDESSIAQLERLVNLHHNNIIVAIKNCNIRFSDKEERYILYMLSGLSNRSICLLLDINDAALYRIRYKVKNKMIEGGLENETAQIFSRR